MLPASLDAVNPTASDLKSTAQVAYLLGQPRAQNRTKRGENGLPSEAGAFGTQGA